MYMVQLEGECDMNYYVFRSHYVIRSHYLIRSHIAKCYWEFYFS